MTAGLLSLIGISNHLVNNVAQKGSSRPDSSHYYPIRLVEHGLPQYWYWYAEIGPANGSSYSGYFSTDKETMTYYEPPGNYSFLVDAFGFNYTTPEPYYYANIVNSTVIVNIYFIEQFNITVFEKGLEDGTQWELNLVQNNYYQTSFSASTPPFRNNLSVWVENGTYTLQVGEMNHYSLLAYHTSMVIEVNGSNIQENVTFHSVNITVKGLDRNVSWGFPEGQSSIELLTKNGSLNLFIPNGNYSFHPVAAGYYSQTIAFSVKNIPSNVTVDFERGYKVTFIEHGLPDIQKNTWSVSGFKIAFDGKIYNISTPADESFLVPNGTYLFNATQGKLYWNINQSNYLVNITVTNSPSSFAVDGSNVTVNIYFNAVILKNLSENKRPATPWPVTYIVFGVIVAGLLAIGITYRKRSRP